MSSRKIRRLINALVLVLVMCFAASCASPAADRGSAGDAPIEVSPAVSVPENKDDTISKDAAGITENAGTVDNNINKENPVSDLDAGEKAGIDDKEVIGEKADNGEGNNGENINTDNSGDTGVNVNTGDTENIKADENGKVTENAEVDENNVATENPENDNAPVQDEDPEETFPDDNDDEPEEASEEIKKKESQKEDKNSSEAKVDSSQDKKAKELVKKLDSSTEIPTLCIYTKNNKEVLSRTEYVDCWVYTVNADEDHELSGAEAGIRVRGNSTAYGGNVDLIRKNQVPYRIKFTGKTNLFGLNDDAKCKNWVLIKAEDNLVKTDIALGLGRRIIRDYCSDGILVKAYLNGSFKGIYELCEQSQVNKHRVNIYETPENYKGTDTGYLLEIDNYGEKPCFWINYCNQAKFTDINGVTKSFKPVTYSIKSDVYSDEQKEFIKNYVNNTFKILYEACAKGNYYVLNDENKLVKAKKKQITKKDSDGNAISPAQIVVERVINIDSVVDMYLLHEIVKSYDVGEGSFYMYADFSPVSEDSRLTFTCPWDFEWAYAGSLTQYHACVFNSESFAATYEERSNPWFIILMKQDWFVEKVKDRWTQLRTKPKKGVKNVISQGMDEVKAQLEKYTDDLGKGAVGRANSLVSWVYKRISFMDSKFLRSKN